MTEADMIEERSSEKLRGRDRRSRNLSTKLTTRAAHAVEEAASREDKTPSEWAVIYCWAVLLARGCAHASSSSSNQSFFERTTLMAAASSEVLMCTA